MADSPGSARRALRAALARGDATWNDTLGVAYMRLLLARRTKRGVRLSADEVHALFTMDYAIASAADNIETELLPEESDA